MGDDSCADGESGVPWSQVWVQRLGLWSLVTGIWHGQSFRQVLPDRAKRFPAVHQHLDGALRPQEVQAAEVVQRTQTGVERSRAIRGWNVLLGRKPKCC